MFYYNKDHINNLFDSIDYYYMALEKPSRHNDYMKERDKMMIKFAYFLGMRRREVATSNIEFIDFKNKVICIPIIFSKNKKRRQIPIPDILFEDLIWYIKKFDLKDYLFVSHIKTKNGIEVKHLSPVALGNRFRLFRDLSGMHCIKDHSKNGSELSLMRFHDLRGTYATTLERNGIRLKVVQNLLGHLHLSSTDRYLSDTSMEERKEAVVKVFDSPTFDYPRSQRLKQTIEVKI
jgi:integrase/recombinase XerC